MRRMLWLAAGPFLVIAVGAWLMLILPDDGKPTKRMGKNGMTLPSGLEAELQEMIWNRPGQGLVYRFRFVAPEFEQTENMNVVMTDLEYLCNEFALPKLANTGPTPNQVIVSLADKPSEFGEFDATVTQVFEAYSVKNDTCIWEMF